LKRVGRLAAVAAAALVASAHVGSPNVVFEGAAGPYDVRVVVRPPLVVPGTADVVVRSSSAELRRVVVRPVFLCVGVAGAPEGDVAQRVPGDSSAFAAQVWLMRAGAYSVYVTVEGARGSGTVVVPVMSVATGRLGLSTPLGGILVVLGVALVAGLVTIVRAAVGESLVPAGESMSRPARRRANVIAAVSLPVIAMLLFGGATWWKSVDADYQRSMFRAPPLVTTVSAVGPRTMLRLTADSGDLYTPLAPLIPDHGKLMHLFLVSEDARSFAHLHPLREDGAFRVVLPPVAAGRYRAFADVTTELGSAVTLEGSVVAPQPRIAVADGSPNDPDDAWITSRAAATIAPGAVDSVAPGLAIAWSGGAGLFTTGHDTELRFEVRDARGVVADLEPYMGMPGHAVITRDDGSVFIHLHPMGTISPTVQRLFALRDKGDTTVNGRLRIDDSALANTPAMNGHAMPASGALSFPYEFPKPGRYHIWVQVKRNGRIVTGAFDAEVR